MINFTVSNQTKLFNEIWIIIAFKKYLCKFLKAKGQQVLHEKQTIEIWKKDAIDFLCLFLKIFGMIDLTYILHLNKY